ncbi:MAG: DUF4153 domain-containing protein [Candidatus Scatovivens sp.]
MSKLKNLFVKMSEKLKEVAKKYPITMVIIIILTIISAVCIDNFIIKTRTLMDILFVGTIWAIGTLFSEVFFENKKIKKYISIILSLLISIFFYNYSYNKNVLFNFTQEKTNIIMENTCGCYIICLILLIVYKLSKKSKLDIKEYLLKVFSESFIVGITYIILNIGISAVAGIFITLILDGEFYTIIYRLLIMVLGLFYIPSMISVFSNTENIKVNTFIEKLLLYVILPLTIISIVIIYIYIAKILILWEIPKNIIGRILIAIYLVAIPVWAMTSAIKNEKFNKIINKIPYTYLPLIILEIYSICTRIHQYGFTSSRYLFVIFIVFQLISFFAIIIKKEKNLRELLLVIFVMVIIYLISPINYRVVSNLSQKNILDQYVKNAIEFNNCSKEEKAKYKGAYRYLKEQFDGDKYINTKLTAEDIEELEKNEYYYNDNKYIYKNKSLKEMDISGYSKIYYFESDYNNRYNIDVNNIKITYGEDEEKETKIDLSKLLEKLIEEKGRYYSDDEYFEENNIISIDNSRRIYITNLNFSYDSKREIESLNVEGYMLEK